MKSASVLVQVRAASLADRHQVVRSPVLLRLAGVVRHTRLMAKSINFEGTRFPVICNGDFTSVCDPDDRRRLLLTVQRNDATGKGIRRDR